MPNSFASWYGTVSIGVDAEKLKARQAGINSLRESANPNLINALIQLALGGKNQPDLTQIAEISKHFEASDPGFDGIPNRKELQVLAGAAIADVMQNSAKFSPRATLSILTSAFEGSRSFPGPVPLVAIATEESATDAERTRGRPDFDKLAAFEVPKFDFEKAKAKIEQTQDFATVAASLSILSDSIKVALRAMLTKQSSAFSAMDNFLRVQDEELQMLWWLIGGRSFDFDCPFDKLPQDGQPLILGKELADNTGALPGPASVKSLLSRTGLKQTRKVSVVGAVNAIAGDWAEKLLSGVDPSPISQPVHFAIKRQIETGETEAWVAGWAATTRLAAGLALNSLSLSEQFYRERLLLTRE